MQELESIGFGDELEVKSSDVGGVADESQKTDWGNQGRGGAIH